MKLNKINTLIVTTALVSCLFLTVLSGCASAPAKETPFHIAFTSMYMNDAAITEYTQTLTGNFPELIIDGNAPLLTPIISGEVKNDLEAGVINDPMVGIAGMMKMPMLVAAGELDVVISNMENAARDARGEMYMPLEDVFTPDEKAILGTRLLSFDLLEADGYDFKPTGEKTPVCGIEITGNDEMRKIFGDQEIGVFIVANTKNLELAKKFILSLVI